MTSQPASSLPPRHPPLRVGLIGVTGYALAYYEALSKLVEAGEVEWGAVTIINRDQAREQVAFFESAGVPIFSDYKDMLEACAEALDWVCVPTGIGWHTRMTVESLRRGLPVLVEKPLAPTLQDVAAIQAAERAAGLTVAVGFQHSYARGTWEIKRRLVEGEIGEILRIDGIGLWPRGKSYYTRNNWAGQLHDGESWVLDSPLQNALSHIVNLVLFFAGPTVEARADLTALEVELYRAKPIPSYDTVRTEVELDTGVRAGVVLSHSTLQTIHPEIRIVGTKGTLTWRFGGAHTFVVGDQIDTFRTRGQIPLREHMFDNVVRRIRGDTTVPICSTELAKGEVKWVNAVHDTAPIHDVPPEYCREVEDETGDVFQAIEMIEYYALRAYHEHSSFADLKAPWAVPPTQRDLSDYDAFEACHITAPIPSLASSIH